MFKGSYLLPRELMGNEQEWKQGRVIRLCSARQGSALVKAVAILRGRKKDRLRIYCWSSRRKTCEWTLTGVWGGTGGIKMTRCMKVPELRWQRRGCVEVGMGRWWKQIGGYAGRLYIVCLGRSVRCASAGVNKALDEEWNSVQSSVLKIKVLKSPGRNIQTRSRKEYRDSKKPWEREAPMPCNVMQAKFSSPAS